jgi:hypothetical protein
MTQDQYGQPGNPGQVVRGEVVRDDEPGTSPTDPATPMTRFQKVASALRGDKPDQPATPAGPDAPDATAPWMAAPPADAQAVRDGAADAGTADDAGADDEVGAVRSPDAGPGDYWDDEADSPAARDDAVAGADGVTAGAAGPGAPDHEATQPNVLAATAPTDEVGAPTDEADEADAPTDEADEADAPTDEADEPAAAPGRHAATVTELRPGDSGTALGGTGASGYGSLLPDSADLRTQWHQIQYAFVDDPRGSVAQAADVLGQVAARLEAAIAERQRGLRDRWESSSGADTETLRETLRMYRSFLDQLLGPTA